MSFLWVICGAGRGVGKTTLALNLCKVLPNSCYAKCGHGKARTDKPRTFFRTLADLNTWLERSRDVYEHIIIESNSLAFQDRGDCVVFINGINGKTHFRKDAEELQAKAQLVICRHSVVSEWEKDLSGQLISGRLCQKVVCCLKAQKEYLFGSTLTVRSKIWFEANGAHTFGKGLARLLENVACSGNLRAAAKDAEMSYRYAWDLIRSAEDRLGKKLLERRAGGLAGGGSVLSAEGKQMLDIFDRLNTEVARYSDECFAKLLKGDCL